ncbi:MAG TPA: TRAP transporter large permease [Xanthobacteraceae bacterium]|nr:TRAP transporter large permease [Xanthobacteraceae bacterium]
MALTMTLVPIVLLFLGFPIFVVLLATAAIAIVIFYSIPLTVLHQVMFGSLDSAALLAVPFFIFAGEIMAAGGISGRLVAWAKSLFGRSKASLPITTVATCVVFGAISGSSVAAVGRITFRPMLDAGYDRRFATGLLTASGLIDNMIPPSIAMILYAIVAEQSLVRIFTAGFVPGLLFALAFVAYVLLKSWGSAIDPPEPFRWTRLGRETLNAAWALGMPVIILGGIYTGVLSANEAGGAACVYAILVAMFVHRDVGVTQLLDLARRSAYVTSQLMVIVASAGVFSWLLTTSGAAPRLADVFAALDLSSAMLLFIVNVFLLLVGIFFDPAPAILLLTPILLPVVKAAGIDLIHFGIVMTANLSIGCFTPPFGINIFVAQAVFKQPVSVIYRGVMPFIWLSIAVLAVITYVPELSLFLTRLHD